MVQCGAVSCQISTETSASIVETVLRAELINSRANDASKV